MTRAALKRAIRVRAPGATHLYDVLRFYCVDHREYGIGPRHLIRQVTAPSRRFLIYPLAGFSHSHVVSKVCTRRGIGVSRDGMEGPFQCAFLWHDETHIAASDRDALLRWVPRAINADCLDIGKDTIDVAHVETFGYGVNIDPATATGPIVKKPILNARHSGAVIQPPVARERSFVYQRLLDNAYGGGLIEDLRFPIFYDVLPFVYRKRRPVETRFSNRNHHCVLDSVEGSVSREELKSILDFSRRIGMDYGEIDAIRDRASGRLYLIDANKTPHGPPNGLDATSARRALDLCCDALDHLVEQFAL